MFKKTILILLIAAWMALMFLFSSQPSVQSAQVSGGITNKVVDIIYSVSKTNLDRNKIDHIVRKTAHYSLYFVGGALLILLFNEYKIKLYQKILYSEMIGMLYAMTDEYHQTFVPGRSGQISDVMLDSLGILTGIIVVYIAIIYKKKFSLSQKSKSV